MKCGSRHGNYYIMWKLKSQHESTVKLRKMFDLHKNSFQTLGIFSQQSYIFVLTFSVFLWYNNYIPKYTENRGLFRKHSFIILGKRNAIPITEKDKANMLDHLAAIYNDALHPGFTLSPNTFCLAVIAICMLENQPTENITRCHKKNRGLSL